MSLYDKRFVLFSGKGGVGKTVISSAFALSCARRGERTLLIELNVQDKVSSFFGSSTVGSDIMEVEDNLYAVNVTPDAALKEYGLMILKVKLIFKAVFENRIVRSFLRSIPGLNDLLMLGKAYYHVNERASDGGYVWDKIIVDAPATGHGMFFLQIPSVLTGFLNSGHMFEEAERIEALLQDAETTALSLVTLPEEMPVNETLMMMEELQDRIGLDVASVVANGVYPPLFDDIDLEWIEAARGSDDPKREELDGYFDAAAFRSQRVGLQQKYLERLEGDVTQPIYYVPYHFTDRVTFPNIADIADELEFQVDGEAAEAAAVSE